MKILIIFTLFSSFSSPLNQSNFREIFGKVTKENKLIDVYTYYLPNNLFHYSTQQESLEKIEQAFRNFSPTDLFQEGVKNRPSQILSDVSMKSIEAQLEKNKITFVVVPGIMGEFIEAKVYQGLFNKNYLKESSFNKEWQRKFKLNPLQDDMLSPYHTRLTDKKLGSTKRPLKNLLNISSLYNKSNDLVNIIHLDVPMFSLESLGDMGHRALIYNRRLEKFFKIMGRVPKNLVFIGYSRGAPIVFDMLLDAKTRKLSWYSKIKSVITLGGVNYGSDVADEAMCTNITKDSPLPCRQLDTIRKFAKSLQYSEEGSNGGIFSAFFSATKFPIMMNNNLRWVRFMFDMFKIDPQSFPEINPNFLFNPQSVKNFENTLQEMDKNITLGTYTNHRISLNLLLKFSLKTLSLGNMSSDYDLNIKRFKIIVDELITSVHQITTSERLKWWKTHNLPNDFPYYNLVGTLMNPLEDNISYQIMNNPWTYNPGSSDYKFLISGYNNIRNFSSSSINDSQMSMHKALLWNKVNAKLNPYYKKNPLKTKLIGVLGVHHWGFAFPVAFKNIDQTINPYPRKELLKSLAIYLSLDLLPDFAESIK